MTACGPAEAGERDRLHERLRNLSTILPVFAQELAAARRQAARLRVENTRLIEELVVLRSTLAGPEHARLHVSGAVRDEGLLAAGPALDRDRRRDRGAPVGA